MNVPQWIAIHLGYRADPTSWYPEDAVAVRPELARMNVAIWTQWKPHKVITSLPVITWKHLPGIIKAALAIRFSGGIYASSNTRWDRR